MYINYVYEIIHTNLHNRIHGRNQILDIKYYWHSLAEKNVFEKAFFNINKLTKLNVKIKKKRRHFI